MSGKDSLDAFEKCLGIKFRAHNLVRAVGQGSYPPIADEGNELIVFFGLDSRTESLSIINARLTFNINQNKIVPARLKHRQTIGMAKARVNMKTRESKNLVTKRPQNFTRANMENETIVTR